MNSRSQLTHPLIQIHQPTYSFTPTHLCRVGVVQLWLHELHTSWPHRQDASGQEAAHVQRDGRLVLVAVGHLHEVDVVLVAVEHLCKIFKVIHVEQ